MSNDEALRKVLGGAGWEALDDIAIYTPKISRPVTRVGLRVSLKFRDGYTLEKRRAFVEVLRAYFDEFRDHLTHWLPNNGNRLQRIVDRQFPPFMDEVSSLPEDEDFGVRLVGYPKGTTTQEPSLYKASGYCVWIQQREHNSHFAAHVPFSWAARHGFDRFREMVKQWCDLLEPAHGTAGPSLLWNDPDSDSYMADSLFLLKKFPGLDHEYPSNFNVEADYWQQQPYKIRSINWLTILGETIISELGGRDSMRAALGESCPLTDYRGGTIVQAGAQPELGSSEDGEIPEDYRKVARLTKPVRFEAYRAGLFRNLPAPFDDREETLEWIRRFD